MKKFLVILMVVAMASFLFVGCLPGVTPPGDDEGEDEDVGAATSTAPVITSITDNDTVPAAVISLYSSSTQYMNKTEVYYGILVTGNAPKYSEVNVYVDDVVVGTGVAYGTNETFTVFVAKADLGADGAKTLYATATESGLAESAASTEYAFTLDVVKPAIASVKADSGDGTITITFNDVVNTVTSATYTTALPLANSALTTTNYEFGDGVSGTLTAASAVSTKIVMFTATISSTLGTSFWVSCTGVGDLAGNTISTSAPSVYTGITVP